MGQIYVVYARQDEKSDHSIIDKKCTGYEGSHFRLTKAVIIMLRNKLDSEKLVTIYVKRTTIEMVIEFHYQGVTYKCRAFGLRIAQQIANTKIRCSVSRSSIFI